MGKDGDEEEKSSKSNSKQSLQMVNNGDNEIPSSLSRGVRSMSMYSSQFLHVVKDKENALFCLDAQNPIRKISKFIVESRYPLIHLAGIFCGIVVTRGLILFVVR